MIPRLKKIDLSKIVDCNHPDIEEEKNYYLAKIDGRWYAGTFSRVGDDLIFNSVYDAGHQLSYGNWDGGWEELYEIVRGKKTKNGRRRK
ncbi:hypothetical protein HYT23_05435 [Candidatus Pacearchaeota archaeon]|nr:hypothetical protein [Candidatus Pacearchaeota archaeon]